MSRYFYGLSVDKVHFFAVFSMLDTSTHNLIPLIDNLNVDLYAANFAKKAVQKGTPYMTILIAILLIVYTLEVI